jgi:hypothetical protein
MKTYICIYIYIYIYMTDKILGFIKTYEPIKTKIKTKIGLN